MKNGYRYAVFDGRFKSKFVNNKKYANTLKNYIEQNAVKHKFVTDAFDWPFSSFNITSTIEDSFDEDFDPGFE